MRSMRDPGALGRLHETIKREVERQTGEVFPTLRDLAIYCHEQGNKRFCDWHKIDDLIGVGFRRKSFSQKYMKEVMIQNALPPWPAELAKLMEVRIEARCTALRMQLAAAEGDRFVLMRKEITDAVSLELKLDEFKDYPMKKAADKMRNLVNRLARSYKEQLAWVDAYLPRRQPPQPQPQQLIAQIQQLQPNPPTGVDLVKAVQGLHAELFGDPPMSSEPTLMQLIQGFVDKQK